MSSLTHQAERGEVWELPEEIAEKCEKELSGVYRPVSLTSHLPLNINGGRVLKPGGRFVYITFGQPHFRKRVLLKPHYKWTLHLRTVGDGFHYFVYILEKER